jgi:putative spermidine/putrescine transport system substrate-binding protein
MLRKLLLGGALSALGLMALQTTVAQAQEKVLRVANYGGSFTAAQKKYAGDLFARRTGITVQYIDANPVDHLSKLIASKGREAPYDVVYLDIDVQSNAIKASVLDKIDASQVPNLEKLYDQAKNPDGYGPGIMFYSIGIAYNVEKFKEAGIPEPTSWEDLWSEKLKGRVAIPDLSTIMGRCFLVASSRLVGADESELSKGIEKIATLEAHSYYNATPTVEALLTSGDVWATPMANGRAWGVIDKGLPLRYVLPKEGGCGGLTTVDIPVGTKMSKEAHQYINTVLDPLPQLGQAYEIPYGPANRTLETTIAAYPKMAERFPSSPAALEQLYIPNWSKYYEGHADAVDLWNRQVIGR